MSIEALLARSVQVFVALLGAYLVVLWFVSIVWTYRDIEARSRNIVTQISATLLPILFPFLGVPLYLILRPKETLDSAFQRSLEEEYLLQDLEELPLCPTCQHFVADDFVLCPHCHTQLRDACPSCERLVDLRWTLCPYCGAEQDGRTSTVPLSTGTKRRTAAADALPTPASANVPDVVSAPKPAAIAAANGSSPRPGERAVLAVVGGRKVTPRQERTEDTDKTQQVELVVPRRRRFLRPGIDLPVNGNGTEASPSLNGSPNGKANGSSNGAHEDQRAPVTVHADRD